MHKYEMDPTRTLGATEQARDADRRMDGQTDGVKQWGGDGYNNFWRQMH